LPRRVGKSGQRLRPGAGRPEEYINCWELGPIARHYLAQGDRSRRATGISSKHSAGSDIVPEDIVSSESGDLAYVVGFERGEVSHDANAPTSMTIRATHIYRSIDAEWCFVHRHAHSHPPIAHPRSGRRRIRLRLMPAPGARIGSHAQTVKMTRMDPMPTESWVRQPLI
jgi:hypothetical protein